MSRVAAFIRGNKWIPSLLLIVVFGLFASRSLFISGFYSSHDGVSHVVRLAKFIQGLSDGQLIPRWSDSLAFGLGSPVLLYYGPLPYLTGLIPRLLGATLSQSIEIVTAVSLIVSGVAFFFWSKDIFGYKAALLGSLFYMWAPYRFLDIYVRGAYPENFAFIFPPLALLSARNIFHGFYKEGFILGATSLSGIILSHNVMTLFFLTVFSLYAVACYLIHRNLRRLWVVIFSLVSSLIITSFYWLPAFFEKNLVNLNHLDISGSYVNNFVELSQIVYSKWGWGPLGSTSPMSLQLGIAQQVLVLMGIASFFLILFKKNSTFRVLANIFKRIGFSVPKRLKREEVVHLVFFLALLLVSLFFMTEKSLFLWTRLPLLSFVLYPWRFLAIAILACAALASFSVKVAKPKTFLIILFLGLLIYSNRNYSQLVGRVYEDDSYYFNYQDTADIWGEYLPTTANLEIIDLCRKQGCKFDKIITPDDSRAKVAAAKSNLLEVSYDSPRDFTATINTFYFPGWKSYLDDVSYEEILINENGTIDINLPKGGHKLVLRFEDTAFRKMALAVSLVGLAGSGLYIIWLKKYLKK